MIFSKSLAVGVFLAACVTPLYAQQTQQLTRPKVEGKVIFGSAVFDEDLEHTLVGGAVRAYVTKRLSIEPEYLYLRRSKDDQDHLVQMNVAFAPPSTLDMSSAADVSSCRGGGHSPG